MTRLNPILVLATLGLALSAGVQAQQAPVPPPPGLNDPGVKPAPPASAPTLPPGSLKGVPKMPAMGAGQGERDGLGQPPPTMDIRTVGGDKVEEYRMNGRVYMIHVIPEHGVPQTYMVNPQGEVMRQPGQPPVKPVLYTLYKWGGPKKEKKDDGN